MTIVTIPNRPLGTDQRSIALILADFDAITAVVNGNLDASNIAPGAGNLKARTLAVNGSASNGDLVIASPGVTVQAPATGTDVNFCVLAASNVTSASPVTINSSSANMFIDDFGLSTTARSQITLGTALSFAWMHYSTPNGVWICRAGKQDTGWLTLSDSVNGALVPPASGRVLAASAIGSRGYFSGGWKPATGTINIQLPASVSPVNPTIVSARGTVSGSMSFNVSPFPGSSGGFASAGETVYLEATYALN